MRDGKWFGEESETEPGWVNVVLTIGALSGTGLLLFEIGRFMVSLIR